MLQPYNGGRRPSSEPPIKLTVPQFLGIIGSVVLFVILMSWCNRVGAEVPPQVILDRLCQLATDAMQQHR